jgi:uncharacterized phage infection (PIP) family protein YhgE
MQQSKKLKEIKNLIRREISLCLQELTQAEKDATIKAAQADVDAKKLALKNAQDRLTKISATPVDQK